MMQGRMAYMPTLPDYPGVSRIRNESPGLPYGSPHLPDKSDFGSFSSTVGYFNYKFSLNPKKMHIFKCMFCFVAEFSSIFHPTVMDAYRNLGGLGPFCNESGVGGWEVIFWGVGEGGWYKRKSLQISDIQRLVSLEWQTNSMTWPL